VQLGFGALRSEDLVAIARPEMRALADRITAALGGVPPLSDPAGALPGAARP
jgi:hypothetical protein